jgi:hypothetical protein
MSEETCAEFVIVNGKKLVCGELLCAHTPDAARMDVGMDHDFVGTRPKGSRLRKPDNPYSFLEALDIAVEELKHESGRLANPPKGVTGLAHTITCGELDVILANVRKATEQLKQLTFPKQERKHAGRAA